MMTQKSLFFFSFWGVPLNGGFGALFTLAAAKKHEGRLLYGNLYTLLGGVGLAVMTARACQLLPNACPLQIYQMFFKFYAQWFKAASLQVNSPSSLTSSNFAADTVYKRSSSELALPSADAAGVNTGRNTPTIAVGDAAALTKIAPIFITPQLKPHHPTRIKCMPETFDPAKEPFSTDLLPVLNPAYPHTNTCYPVGKSSIGWLRQELARALSFVQSSAGEARDAKWWTHLWDCYSIFSDFSVFVVVRITTSDANDMAVWSGFVESRIKILIYALETCDGVLVRPFPCRSYESPTCVAFAIAVSLKESSSTPTCSGCLALPCDSEELASRLRMHEGVQQALEDFAFSLSPEGQHFPMFARGPTMLGPTICIEHRKEQLPSRLCGGGGVYFGSKDSAGDVLCDLQGPSVGHVADHAKHNKETANYVSPRHKRKRQIL